jgi:hypothetical protein
VIPYIREVSRQESVCWETARVQAISKLIIV